MITPKTTDASDGSAEALRSADQRVDDAVVPPGSHHVTGGSIVLGDAAVATGAAELFVVVARIGAAMGVIPTDDRGPSRDVILGIVRVAAGGIAARRGGERIRVVRVFINEPRIFAIAEIR